MEEVLWTEKYRPKTIAECVLPESMKEQFQDYITSEKFPNLLLSGPTGCGKTTVAKAMLEELDCDYMFKNASLESNIDTLRNDILQFASTMSFKGKRKYVILDEADGLNPQSFQPALRGFMEQYSEACGFILTCNFPHKILEPIQSRLAMIEFDFRGEDKKAMAREFFMRACDVLTSENVEFDRKVVAKLVQKMFPDFRRTINILQKHSTTRGKIDDTMMLSFSDENFNNLIDMLKNKRFKDMRTWVHENHDIHELVHRKIYDTAYEYFRGEADVAKACMVIADHQSRIVTDKEVQLTAFLVEIMYGCDFK